MNWLSLSADFRTAFKYRKLDCKQRVKLLADEMKGEDFQIWYGIRRDVNEDDPKRWHVWIEWKGIILDPTLEDDDPKRYNKIGRATLEELAKFDKEKT